MHYFLDMLLHHPGPIAIIFSEVEKKEEARKKQDAKLQTAKKYIELLQPKYYIPFAGRYTLCGKNADLNPYRGEPELGDADEWLRKQYRSEKTLRNNFE